MRKTITLNRNFYDREAILEALEDFCEVCDGRIGNDYFEIELDADEDIENLEEEFGNYVLGLMKHEGLV